MKDTSYFDYAKGLIDTLNSVQGVNIKESFDEDDDYFYHNLILDFRMEENHPFILGFDIQDSSFNYNHLNKIKKENETNIDIFYSENRNRFFSEIIIKSFNGVWSTGVE